MIEHLTSHNPQPGPGGNPGPAPATQPDELAVAAAIALIERAEFQSVPTTPLTPIARPIDNSVRPGLVLALAGAAVVLLAVVLSRGPSTEEGTGIADRPPPTAVELTPAPIVDGAVEIAAGTAPTLTVTEVGLDAFAVAGEGWPTGETVTIELCELELSACRPLLDSTVEADGSFHRRTRIQSAISLGGADCRIVDCVIRASGPRAESDEVAPIAFGRSSELGLDASITVSQTERLSVGQIVAVSGTGWPADRTLEARQCGQFLICSSLGMIQTAADGSFTLDVGLAPTIDAGFTTTDCRSDPCAVVIELLGPTSQIDQLSTAVAFEPGGDFGFATVTDTYTPTMGPGDAVLITISGATPGDRYEFGQCTDGFYCSQTVSVTADASGSAQARVPLVQHIDTATGTVDCVLDGGCYLTNRHREQQTPHSWGPITLAF